MNRSRKWIAAILSAAMIATASPAAALADDEENPPVVSEYSSSENQEQQEQPEISEGSGQEEARNPSEDQEKEEEPSQTETPEPPEQLPENPEQPEEPGQEETSQEPAPSEQPGEPEKAPEQPEKSDEELPIVNFSEEVFSYNLGIGAGTVSIHKDEIAEDGSFTIPLEDDAFFPYSLQIQHDGKTWVETFDTMDDTIKLGEYRVGVETHYSGDSLSQIGVYIDGEYYPAVPEEKTFGEEGIQPFSLLPPVNDDYNRYFRLDLTSIALDKKDKIQVSAIIGQIKEQTGTLDTANKTVLWNYTYDAENGVYLPSDSFRPMGDGTVDLSRVSNYVSFDLIVGTGHQLDVGHLRYTLSVYLSSKPDFSGHYQELDKDGNILNKSENGGFYRKDAPDIYIFRYNAPEPLNPEREYRFILYRYNTVNEFETHIYKGEEYFDSKEAAIEKGEDVTEKMLDTYWSSPSGYPVDFSKEECFTAITTMPGNDEYIHFRKFRLEFGEVNNTRINFSGLYQYNSDSDRYSYAVYRDSNEGIDVSGKSVQKYTCYLLGGYLTNKEYFARFTCSPNNSKVVKAVVGHYESLEDAEKQQDIKEELFGDGYSAVFKDGVDFTVFVEQPKEGNASVFYYTIKAYLYPGSSNSVISFNGVEGYNASQIYLLQNENDSGTEQFGYRLILIDDETADLSKLKPTYDVRQKGIAVYVKGKPEKEYIEPFDFSNGKSVQYTARAENGEDICNYWLFIEQAVPEAELYVVVDGEKANEREVFFNSWTDDHHDIFIANIGKENLTGLKVELTDAKNVKLDDYWTVGGENNNILPGIDKTTSSYPWSSSPDYMDGTAKIRLLPNGKGEVSGTLTISADNGDKYVIKLQGEAGDPQIITEQEQLNNRNAVKYVPYSFLFQNNNKYEWNKTTFSLKKVEGQRLPKGIVLRPSGELYGVPTETGTFTFTVQMKNSFSTFDNDEREYTLVVLENTDSNVEGETDENYGILDRVQNMTITETMDMPESNVRNQEFRSEGEFVQFIDFWLDGDKLVKGTDYDANEGSTVITIFAQTFANYGAGTHTIAAEFRTNDEKNELKCTAQNYNLTIQGSSSGSGGDGDNNDNNTSSVDSGSSGSGSSQSSEYVNPVTAAQQAAASQNSESTSPRLRVRLKGVNLVTLPEFREMSSIARKEGKEPWLDVDTMVDGTNRVDIRVGLNTELPQTDLYMAGSSQNTRTALVKTIFERYFSNRIIAIINLSQKESFGLTANICVKVPDGEKAEDLHFYSYNYERNSYKVIQEPKAWIDQNHYLHFDTPYASDIVITAGELVLN